VLDDDDDGRARRRGASPAIRAIQTRTLVESLPRLPPAQRERIASRASPSLLERARRSFAMAWFPMADHMNFCVVVDDVVGREAFVALQREAFASAIQTPMLRGIFGMLSRVSDDSVATLLRNAPRLYGHVTRDIGRLEVTGDGPGRATLELSGWPSELFDFDVWLVGTQACIDTALLGVGALGTTLELDQCVPERGFAIYRVRW